MNENEQLTWWLRKCIMRFDKTIVRIVVRWGVCRWWAGIELTCPVYIHCRSVRRRRTERLFCRTCTPTKINESLGKLNSSTLFECKLEFCFTLRRTGEMKTI